MSDDDPWTQQPQTRFFLQWDDVTVELCYPGHASPDVLDDLRVHALKAFTEAVTLIAEKAAALPQIVSDDE